MATVMSSFLRVKVANTRGEVLCLLDIYGDAQFTHFALVYLCLLKVCTRTVLAGEEERN